MGSIKTTDVVLADSHILVREGMARLLKRQSGIRIAGAASSFEELEELLIHRPCRVLVLDYSLTSGRRLNNLPAIKQSNPGIRILVTSIYNQEWYALSAIRLGADAFLWKGRPAGELTKAVLALGRGERYIDMDLSEYLTYRQYSLFREPFENLISSRELEVVRQLAGGNTLNGIASCLGLDVRTVCTYRTRVLEKMGWKTTADLISFAIRAGLGH